MTDDTTRYDQMRAQVARLYDRNRQQGVAPWCNKPYDFVCPSTGTYPFQWLWDSCFHTVALAHLDVDRARMELRSLLENQEPDGFIGHVTFWQREKYEPVIANYKIAWRTRYVSDCFQPPVLAEAIAAAARGPGRDGFLRQILPRARRFFDWCDRVRDPDQDGLIATLQPDESGLDHIPKYDGYLGIDATNPTLAAFDAAWDRCTAPYAQVGRDPSKMFEADSFVCEDVLVNAIYGENERVLASLLREIGDDGGASELDARADRTVRGLVEKCWDEADGLFYDLGGLREEKLRVNTITSLMPLILQDLPRAQVLRLVAQLEDPSKYAAPFPVPTVPLDAPTFRPDTVGGRLLWRGPAWLNTNWYLARGLRRHGFAARAKLIEDASAALVEQSGFREYYNPLTGEGHGAHDFSWTALALDLIAPADRRSP